MPVGLEGVDIEDMLQAKIDQQVAAERAEKARAFKRTIMSLVIGFMIFMFIKSGALRDLAHVIRFLSIAFIMVLGGYSVYKTIDKAVTPNLSLASPSPKYRPSVHPRPARKCIQPSYVYVRIPGGAESLNPVDLSQCVNKDEEPKPSEEEEPAQSEEPKPSEEEEPPQAQKDETFESVPSEPFVDVPPTSPEPEGEELSAEEVDRPAEDPQE